MNLTDLNTFSFVAETGTISAAAQRLGVPKSTVSRRIQRLEDALGHELLRRSSRSTSLTEHGKVLHQRSAASLNELRAAGDALVNADSEPSGTLRLTTVAGLGQSHRFIRCLSEFGRQYTKVTVELELTSRLVQIAEEGFDIGIRLHTDQLPAQANLMTRRLLQLNRGVYASPDYVREMGAPEHPSELEGHRLAAHSIVDVRGIQWNYHGAPTGKRQKLPNPRWLVNDSAALERFALSGAGLAILSTVEGESMVERGELIRVMPHYDRGGATASLIWPASRHLTPRVRSFIDHATESIGSPRI